MSIARANCLCGKFTITVRGSFGDVRYCHCSQCRRKTGTAFSVNARIDKSQFMIDGPESEITEFEHKSGLFNAFCTGCGSPLYARSSDAPDDIRVRLGGFEGDIDVNIAGHVWIASKANWYDADDLLPQHDHKFEDDI